MPQEFITIAIALLTGIFSLIGWFLKDKDAKQQSALEAHDKQIEVLFSKHDADVQALQDMRVLLAQEHYRKPELDTRLERLDSSIREGLSTISIKVDKLTEAVLGVHK